MSARDYIDHECKYDEALKYNVECLDKYDFCEFLNDGRSLYDICNAIEDKYDNEFLEKFGIYVFDSISNEDLTYYFKSRYNVWFQEYTDWVVRHDNGAYEKTRRRVEDSP